jgi:hypothetical protein
MNWGPGLAFCPLASCESAAKFLLTINKKRGRPMVRTGFAVVWVGGVAQAPFGLERCGLLSVQAAILQCLVTHLLGEPRTQAVPRGEGAGWVGLGCGGDQPPMRAGQRCQFFGAGGRRP